MTENRRHLRIREFIDVAWRVEDQGVSGEGLVVNISSSGAFLQTDRVFQPTDNCVLIIEPETEEVPFESKKGKLMWFRRIHTPQERFQLGLQFVEDQEDEKFHQWLEMKINQLGEASDTKILGNRAF